MAHATDLRLEAATGLSLGARESQEDAVLCDVPQGGAAGIVVLADGLGGHTGGALASRIAVTTALRELASHRDATGCLQGDIPALLRICVDAANHALLAQAEDTPEVSGMGTTLVLAVVQYDQLYWISVGDSPLYLLRDGDLRQLNETHSLAAHLDLLVKVGEMTPEEAAAHPGRSCLTSALGSEAIERIDCPDAPLDLRGGDILLAASDGILTLARSEIAATLQDAVGSSSAELAARLLDDVAALRSEGQDNVSIAVLQADAAPEASGAMRPKTAASPFWTGLLRGLSRGRRLSPGDAPTLGAAMASAPEAVGSGAKSHDA